MIDFDVLQARIEANVNDGIDAYDQFERLLERAGVSDDFRQRLEDKLTGMAVFALMSVAHGNAQPYAALHGATRNGITIGLMIAEMIQESE